MAKIFSRRRLLTSGAIAGTGLAAATVPPLVRAGNAEAATAAVTTSAQWIAPSGDMTGATDTNNIQTQLDSAGHVAWLAPGQFYIRTTLLFSADNTVLYGQGRGATRLTVATSQAFQGARVVNTQGFSFCEVRDLCIAGPSGSLGSATRLDGISMSGGIRCRIANVYFFDLNGWGYVFDGSTGNCAGLVLENLLADTCAGAISLTGPSSGYRGSATLIAPSGVNMGTPNGPVGGQPLFAFTDFEDVTFFGHPATTPVNGAGAIVITGNCAALYFYGTDMGGTQAHPAVLIRDGSGSSPTSIGFHGGILQQGSTGAQVTGGASRILFDGIQFAHNQSHGLSIEAATATGTTNGEFIVVSRCFFEDNGRGAVGNNYDLNWSGTATGQVSKNNFDSPIVAVGAQGVQFSINNAEPAVQYELNSFGSPSNNYVNPPVHVINSP